MVRWIAAISTIAVLVLALAPARADERISVGVSKTGMLVWLAEAMGALDAVDVALEEIGSGVVAARRVEEGSLSFGASSEFAFVSRTLSSAPLCVYATISASRTTQLISRADKVGPDPRSLSDKRVAVTKNSIGQYFLSQFLLLSGIAEESVEIVNGAPEDIVRLVVSGEVDAGITWEPHATRIRSALGPNAQTYQDQQDQYFYFVLHGRCVQSEREQEVLLDFLSALLAAENLASSSPTKAQQLLASNLDLSLDEVRAIWPQHSIGLSLPQDLLLAMEAEAEWRIAVGASEGPAPNMLSHIKAGPLRSVSPSAVGIVE